MLYDHVYFVLLFIIFFSADYTNSSLLVHVITELNKNMSRDANVCRFQFTPRGCRLKLLVVFSCTCKVIFSNPSLSAWYCSSIHNGDLRYVKCGLYINLYVFRCILIWFKLVVAHLFWFPLFPHVCDLVYVGSLIYSAEPSIIRIRHC